MLRWTLLLVLVGAAVVQAQLQLLSSTTHVEVVDGVARNVHELSVECDQSSVGKHNVTVTDPSSKREYDVEVNCQPPVYNFDARLMGWTARDLAVDRRTVCLTTQLTVAKKVRAEFQSVLERELPRNHRAAVMRARQNATAHGLSPRRVEEQEVVAGAAVIIAGAALYCTIKGCGNHDAEFAKAINKVAGDLAKGMGEIHSFEEAQFRYDEESSRYQQRISDRQILIARGVQDNARSIRELAGGLGDLTAYTTSFAAAATHELNQLHDAMRAEVLALGAVGTKLMDAHDQTEREIQEVLTAVLTNARHLSSVENSLYRIRMNQDTRRDLTGAFYDAVADPPQFFQGQPFIQATQLSPPKSEAQINLHYRSLDGAAKIATSSVQGTVVSGGQRLATQVDFELYADPVWIGDNFIPGAGITDIVSNLGGDRLDGSQCHTPPTETNGSVPLWNCKSVLVITGTHCAISDPAVSFPYDFAGVNGGIDLRADRAEGRLPPECSSFVASPYGGLTGAPASFYTRAGFFDAALGDVCSAPMGGTWEVYSGTGNTTVASPRVRVMRTDSTNYNDLTLNTTAFADACVGATGAFQRNDHNLDRLAFHVWHNVRKSYAESATFNMAEREIELYGRMPGNMTYTHDHFSPDPETDALQRCDTVIVPFVRDTGVLDADVLEVRKWEQVGYAESGASVRIFDRQGASVSAPVVFGNQRAGKAPMPNPSAGDYRFGVATEVSDESEALLPRGRLLLENESWWRRHGVVFDVEANNVRVEPSASARAGSATYVLRRRHVNGTTGVLSSDKTHETLEMQSWLDQNLAAFHADRIGDSAQMYSRFYDPAAGCGNSELRVGGDSGTFQPNNDLCNMLDAYEVLHTPGQDRHVLRPRAAWHTRVTFQVPGAVFEMQRTSGCPMVNVTVVGGRADVALQADKGSHDEEVVCAVVVGVSDAGATALEPNCTRTVVQQTVPAYGGASVSLPPVFDNSGAGCVAQYLQLYPLPVESTVCPPSEMLLAGDSTSDPCYAGSFGLSLGTSRASVPGDTFTGTAVDAHVTREIDRASALLRRLANATDSDEALLQRAIRAAGGDSAEIRSELAKIIAEQKARIANITTINQGELDRATAELEAQEARIEKDVEERSQRVIDQMGKVIAEARADIADSEETYGELLRRMHNSLAAQNVTLAQIQKDLAAARKAASNIDDGGGILGGLTSIGGGLGDLFKDLFHSPFGWLWKLLNAALTIGVIVVVICLGLPALRTCCSLVKSTGGRVAHVDDDEYDSDEYDDGPYPGRLH